MHAAAAWHLTNLHQGLLVDVLKMGHVHDDGVGRDPLSGEAVIFCGDARNDDVGLPHKGFLRVGHLHIGKPW